jgi:hypothetical protein
MLPAEGLGVPHRYKKSPKLGGFRGLIQTISEQSHKIMS